MWAEIVGDKDARTVTREDVRTFKDALLRLPPNFARRFPGKTAKEIANGGPYAERLSPKRVNNYVLDLATFFGWAEVNGYVDRNPAKSLRVSDPRRPDEQRKAFTREQLQTLFGRPQEGPVSHTWVPLVGLYTGMRLGEILQLGPADVIHQDGVPSIRIAFADGKHLKTKAAERLVPVHPDLQRLGFLRFATAARGSRLWPDYSNASGVDRFSKTFGRLLTRLGIKDEGLSFHSLRHTFTNALKQAGVPEPTIAELVGHAGQSITLHRYGKRYEVRVLAEAVGKIAYALTLGPLEAHSDERR